MVSEELTWKDNIGSPLSQSNESFEIIALDDAIRIRIENVHFDMSSQKSHFSVRDSEFVFVQGA